MAKKNNNVNIATINKLGMAYLSDYHKAVKAVKRLTTEYRADLSVLEEELEAGLEKFNNAISDGKTIEEAFQIFDRSTVDDAINKRKAEFTLACKPHKQAMNNAYKLIPDTMYDGYITNITKGNATPMRKDVVTFCDSLNIGCKDLAGTTFTNIMTARIAGARKAKADSEHYIAEKSKKQFKELFLLALLEYAIIDKKVFVVNEDDSLTNKYAK